MEVNSLLLCVTFPGGPDPGSSENGPALVVLPPALAPNPCRQENHAIMDGSGSGSGEVNQLWLRINLRVECPSDPRIGRNFQLPIPAQAPAPAQQPRLSRQNK